MKSPDWRQGNRPGDLYALLWHKDSTWNRDGGASWKGQDLRVRPEYQFLSFSEKQLLKKKEEFEIKVDVETDHGSLLSLRLHLTEEPQGVPVGRTRIGVETPRF